LHGGLGGIHDQNLLESALGAPKQCFDGHFLNKDIFQMAAAYFISLANNHAFNEGNKRTAYFSVFTFLYKNGFLLDLEENEAIGVTMMIANKQLAKEEIADFLRTHTSVIKTSKA